MRNVTERSSAPPAPPPGLRVKRLTLRALEVVGAGEGGFLVILSVLIGIVTACAAVAFHGLIVVIRHQLYGHVSADVLYGRGMWLLVAIPAGGGLAVALLSRWVFREREGHGIVDVMESVLRTSGFVRFRTAIEKIVTSAVTIGSGGSAGAEGPIVQIGAAIASGFGKVFGLTRMQMPILIGCGSAAGISAIFDSPIGGLLFTLEVILRDFSLRTLTPLVIASVIANFATASLFRSVLHEPYTAIFHLGGGGISLAGIDLAHSVHFVALGICCGLVGVGMTKLMHTSEERFARLTMPKTLKPALGGAMLGVLGVLYVVVIAQWGLGRQKFIPFEHYEMPAFFGDGYGAVRPMLGEAFYGQLPFWPLFGVLAFLAAAKIVGTCFTLGSGGAGGIIAPSLFLGAVTGGAVGLLLDASGLAHGLSPPACALVAMGAVLAAVVHAPLAAMMILLDVTHRYELLLPGMLTTICATACAQMISRDSIYTAGLRRRGILPGGGADASLLRRMTLEQVALSPAIAVRPGDPVQRVVELMSSTGMGDFVVLDERGAYRGMLYADSVQTALLEPEAIPLLTVGELARVDVTPVAVREDLTAVLDAFARRDVAVLPVRGRGQEEHIIGLITRGALLRSYQRALASG